MGIVWMMTIYGPVPVSVPLMLPAPRREPDPNNLIRVDFKRKRREPPR